MVPVKVLNKLEKKKKIFKMVINVNNFKYQKKFPPNIFEIEQFSTIFKYIYFIIFISKRRKWKIKIFKLIGK